MASSAWCPRRIELEGTGASPSSEMMRADARLQQVMILCCMRGVGCL